MSEHIDRNKRLAKAYISTEVLIIMAFALILQKLHNHLYAEFNCSTVVLNYRVEGGKLEAKYDMKSSRGMSFLIETGDPRDEAS